MPEAMSAATTAASHSLIAAIASRAGERGAPSNPVPKIASITTPEPERSMPSPGSRTTPTSSLERLAPESLESSSEGQSRRASTSRPAAARRRAATNPSPPLFPFPQTILAGPAFARTRAASANAAPAASIRSREGTPCPSIAQPSAPRIPAASNSGSSQASGTSPNLLSVVAELRCCDCSRDVALRPRAVLYAENQAREHAPIADPGAGDEVVQPVQVRLCLLDLRIG